MRYIPTDEDVNIVASYILSEVQDRWKAVRDDLPSCLRLDSSEFNADVLDVSIEDIFCAKRGYSGIALKDVPVEISADNGGIFWDARTAQDVIDTFANWIASDVKTLDILMPHSMNERDIERADAFIVKLNIRLFPHMEKNSNFLTLRSIILQSIMERLRNLF